MCVYNYFGHIETKVLIIFIISDSLLFWWSQVTFETKSNISYISMTNYKSAMISISAIELLRMCCHPYKLHFLIRIIRRSLDVRTTLNSIGTKIPGSLRGCQKHSQTSGMDPGRSLGITNNICRGMRSERGGIRSKRGGVRSEREIWALTSWKFGKGMGYGHVCTKKVINWEYRIDSTKIVSLFLLVSYFYHYHPMLIIFL